MAIQITNAQELYNIRNDLTADYELASDINFVGTDWETNWTPIGIDEENKFTGTFDGKGFTIHNFQMICKGLLQNYGLFGWAENAILKNVNFLDGFISTEDDDRHNIGLLCGRASLNLEISNVYVNKCEISVVNDSPAFIGMVLGGGWNNDLDIYLEFTNVHANDCSIKHLITEDPEGTYFGGLIGAFDEYHMNDSTIIIDNCTFINSSEDYYLSSPGYQLGGIIGGIDGDFSNVAITNCEVETLIYMPKGGYGAGGIVGIIYSYLSTPSDIKVLVENCNYTGNMRVRNQTFDTSDNNIFTAGGIVATQWGAITKNCHSRGELLLGQWTGGVVGYCESGSNQVLDCSFEGDFVGTYMAGGIIGSLENSCVVKRCWANIEKWKIRYIDGYYRWAIGGAFGYWSYWRPSDEEITLAFNSKALVIEDCYARVGNLHYEYADNYTGDDYTEGMGCVIGYLDGGGGTIKRVYSDISLTVEKLEGEYEPEDTFDFGKFGSIFINHRTGYEHEGAPLILNDVYVNEENLSEEVYYTVMYSENTVEGSYISNLPNDNWEGVNLRDTSEMTIPYAPNTYLNFEWDSVWYSYKGINDTFPILYEMISNDNAIYFINEPTIKTRQISANHIIVSSSTATYELAIRNLSKDRYITRYIEIEEGDLDICRQVAEELLERWSKKRLSVDGEIRLRQDLDFKKEVTVIIPEYELVKKMPVQKIQHDIINQRTQITCGDLILSDNELLSRILENIK